MSKPKHWMDGFTSKAEETEYWRQEGIKYQAYLNSQKSKKSTSKFYNPNMSSIDREFNFANQ
jgi:hypothetical protein